MNIFLPRKNFKWMWQNAFEKQDGLKAKASLPWEEKGPRRPSPASCARTGSTLPSGSGRWFPEVARALAALHTAHSVCHVKWELMYYCLETDSQLVLKDKCFTLNSHHGIFFSFPQVSLSHFSSKRLWVPEAVCCPFAPNCIGLKHWFLFCYSPIVKGLECEKHG